MLINLEFKSLALTFLKRVSEKFRNNGVRYRYQVHQSFYMNLIVELFVTHLQPQYWSSAKMVLTEAGDIEEVLLHAMIGLPKLISDWFPWLLLCSHVIVMVTYVENYIFFPIEVYPNCVFKLNYYKQNMSRIAI